MTGSWRAVFALAALVAAWAVAPSGARSDGSPQLRVPPLYVADRGLRLEPVPAAGLRPTPKSEFRAGLPQAQDARGRWGGEACPPASELRSLVDDHLSTPNAAFPSLGPTVPGLSVSWSSDDCGMFTYAAGLENVEHRRRITPETLMGIASMTKPVIAAVTLKLNERGLFGRRGLDTPVEQLLTKKQIAALTVGDDPEHPRCPGSALLLDRRKYWYEGETVYVKTPFSCPDLSKVTVRQLMTANHGMYDYLNEVALPSGLSQYVEGVYFELLRDLGLHPTHPESSRSGFEYLKAFGLKRNDSAVIGGNLDSRDFEISFGNTGFQLLGVILEQQTKKSLGELVRELIVKPLRLDGMTLYLDPKSEGNRIADGYEIVTGDRLFETSDVYPLATFNRHLALNTLSVGLGLPANLTTAGGAAGLVANMRSYRAFLDAFVNGSLLGRSGKAELERSWVFEPEFSTPERSFFNGLGLFRDRLRGFGGLPDLDLISHGGSLPGVLCESAVVLRSVPRIAPVTGAMCINANGNAYPDEAQLKLEFIRAIVAAHSASSSAGR